MSQKFYDDQEAEQILRLAAQRSTSGGVSRDRLLATAAELGITPEAVEEAEQALVRQQSETKHRADFARYQKRDFYTHLSAYVIINTFLVAIYLITDREYFWPIWPMLGWGIGIAFHAIATFFKGSADYEKEYEKWLAKRIVQNPYNPERAKILVDQWFAVHPNDTLGGIKYLREQMAMSLIDAKYEVERHLSR